MYYVHYITPYPDYKRPYVDAFVKFYNTEKEADLGILDYKNNLLKEWNCHGEYTFADLDTEVYFDHIYGSYYMQMPTYTAKKGKVIPQ